MASRGGHGLGYLLHEIGKVLQAHHRRGDLFDRALAAEAGQPVLDIGGVAGLAHLAVVEHVDARVRLPLHGLPHGRPHLAGEPGFVDGLARLLRQHERQELGRSRQAAGVRRQDPLCSRLHGAPSRQSTGARGTVLCDDSPSRPIRYVT
jgi:hypothetical protein